MKKSVLYFVLFVSLVSLSVIAVVHGSVRIPLKDIVSILTSGNNGDSRRYIITKLRLPRTVGAVLIGAGLACSGLIFQAVFKNPMADSYMLGISSSASFSVCLSFLLLPVISSTFSISIFAFTGSVICSVFLFSVSKKNTFRLLLTGIAINFFFSAATTLLIFLNRKQLDSVLFWTMGSLASLDWTKILIISIVTVFSIIVAYKERYTLDLLLFNEETARSSGINPEKKRLFLLIIASVTTAIIVSFCGVIGFVGMLSSHIIRLLLGPKHGRIIVPTALFGSIILLLSDIISRTVIAPSELPIGVISSVLGAPLLFILIRRNNHGFGNN